MRLVCGLLMLAAVAFPQTLAAQAQRTKTSVIQSNSTSQGAPPLQLSVARQKVPSQLHAQQAAGFIDFGNITTDLGQYEFLVGNEGDKAPVNVSSGERPPLSGTAAKAAFHPRQESRRAPVRLWRTLAVVGHGAAVFDAWSTRDAIQNSGAHELNPLFRPFAGSGAVYAATQVGAGLFDYLGYRMMRSRKGWMRRFWWVPQLAGTVGSLLSGAHNLVFTRSGSPAPVH